MTSPDDSTISPAAPKPVSVDDVLIALQKTLSRVSRSSAGLGPEAARALVTGNVQFEISIPVAFDGDSRLVVAQTGGQPLRLNGQISTDVRVVEHSRPVSPAAPTVVPPAGASAGAAGASG